MKKLAAHVLQVLPVPLSLFAPLSLLFSRSISLSCIFAHSQYCNFANASTRAAQEKRYANRVSHLFEREYLRKQKDLDPDTHPDRSDKRPDKDAEKQSSHNQKYKPGDKKGDSVRSVLTSRP